MRVGISVGIGVLGIALALAVGVDPVAAENLTVNVTAHVVQIDDPDNVFGGQLSIGQVGRGTYSYETTVPDSFTWTPEMGEYRQTPQQGRMSFSIGPFTIESDPASPNWMFLIEVQASAASYLQDLFMVSSNANKPLSNGAPVWWFGIVLEDQFLGALTSDALPTSALDLSKFPSRHVHVSGGSPTGGFYTVRLEIDSMNVGPSLQVSPASSVFIRMQRIHPAMLVLGGTQVSTLRGNVNGVQLPASYLEQCDAAPLTTPNTVALACPDIIPLLAGGANHVEWSADLADGSTATSAVDWELIE